jgi:hypothetical protein
MATPQGPKASACVSWKPTLCLEGATSNRLRRWRPSRKLMGVKLPREESCEREKGWTIGFMN